MRVGCSASCAEDMFRQNNTCCMISRLLCLVAATCAAVVPPGSAAKSCAIAGKVRAVGQSCALSTKSCCCAPADKPRACQCPRKSDPQEPKTPVSKFSGRELTWTYLSAAPLAVLTAENSVQALSVSRSDFSSPPQPSVQAMFCTWRI